MIDWSKITVDCAKCTFFNKWGETTREEKVVMGQSEGKGKYSQAHTLQTVVICESSFSP